MKKKLVIIIFILVLIIAAVAIYFAINTQEQTYEVEQEIYSEIAEIRIKEGTLTNTSATIIIQNKTESPIGYGKEYRIDKQINGEWREIKAKDEDYIIDAIGYLIDGGKETEEKIDWTDLYGELKKGKYRLVKEIGSKYASVEFEIE